MRSNIRQDRLSLSSALGVSANSTKLRRPASKPVQLETKSLFKGQRELHINHNDETYRLSITKLGKLILTK